jgi:hypothetical protein
MRKIWSSPVFVCVFADVCEKGGWECVVVCLSECVYSFKLCFCPRRREAHHFLSVIVSVEVVISIYSVPVYCTLSTVCYSRILAHDQWYSWRSKSTECSAHSYQQRDTKVFCSFSLTHWNLIWSNWLGLGFFSGNVIWPGQQKQLLSLLAAYNMSQDFSLVTWSGKSPGPIHDLNLLSVSTKSSSTMTDYASSSFNSRKTGQYLILFAAFCTCE